MSTIKAVNFQHPNASTPSITLNADGSVTGGLPYPNRNLLYNGAMQVAQRGTSATGITAFGYYTADRWTTEVASAGTWTQTVENDAPTGSGFRKSLKYSCTTANSSLGANSYIAAAQYLEGQDVQRIAKGTPSAQQLTLSFWVKSNVAGTYAVSLFDVDTPSFRQVSSSYTISAPATWEKKSITFPADAAGVLDNDNAESLRVYFALAAGSSYTSGTLQTAWAAYNAANRFVGQTNLAAAVNNYWQITGVQLEVGPVATPFEFKSYGQELRECQRYLYVIADQRETQQQIIIAVVAGWGGAGYFYGSLTYPAMRTAPTLKQTTGTNYWYVFAAESGSGLGFDLLYFDRASKTSGRLIVSRGGGTNGYAYWVASQNNAVWAALEAEL